MNRREFSWLLTTSALARTPSPTRTWLYAAVGPELSWWTLDPAGAALNRQGAVTLPANVQYAWPHVSKKFLYVASSDGVPGATTPVSSGIHHLTAFRIDPATGALTPHGAPIPLPARPIHLTSDADSTHLLAAFNNPSGLRVFNLNPDATLGAEVRQTAPLDPGIYAHQIRISPDNRLAILVTRGNDAAGGHPEDPGALKVFRYETGQLTHEVSIAPHGGFGFGPRHLDFHPSKPWVYVSLERQSRLFVYRRTEDTLQPDAIFETDTLAQPSRFPQAAGTVHVHPNGRFVYAVNRADTTIDSEGRRIFAGGENSLAVYAIDQASGAPKPIQHIDTGGIHCRTFQIDPTGRILVAAHVAPMLVRQGGAPREVPAGMSIFRIANNGKLTLARKIPIDVAAKTLFWIGMVAA